MSELDELVAYLAGEPHADAPAGACPVLTAYAVSINDAMGDGLDGDALRARYLHDLAPMLVGSRSTPEVEQARAFVLADHAVRVFAPLALDSAGHKEQADRLRALDAVMDEHTARDAAQAAQAAQAAASDAAAWDVARAARAAAWATWGTARATAKATWAAQAATWAAWSAETAAWDAAQAALIAALEASNG